MESSTPLPGLHKCCGREGGCAEHTCCSNSVEQVWWHTAAVVETLPNSPWNFPESLSLIPDVSDLWSCSILSQTSCMRVWLMLESMTCQMQFRTALAWASTAAALSSTLSRKFLKKKTTGAGIWAASILILLLLLPNHEIIQQVLCEITPKITLIWV